MTALILTGQAEAAADDGVAWVGPTDAGGNVDFLLTSTPADFLSMSSAAANLKMWVSGTPGDDTWTAAVVVVKAGGNIAIAAADSAGTPVGLGTLPATETLLTANFGWVDTTATKADWDDAELRITFNYSKSKGGDGRTACVDYVEVVGDYVADPNSPVTVTLTPTLDALKFDDGVYYDGFSVDTDAISHFSMDVPTSLVEVVGTTVYVGLWGRLENPWADDRYALAVRVQSSDGTILAAYVDNENYLIAGDFTSSTDQFHDATLTIKDWTPEKWRDAQLSIWHYYPSTGVVGANDGNRVLLDQAYIEVNIRAEGRSILPALTQTATGSHAYKRRFTLPKIVLDVGAPPKPLASPEERSAQLVMRYAARVSSVDWGSGNLEIEAYEAGVFLGSVITRLNRAGAIEHRILRFDTPVSNWNALQVHLGGSVGRDAVLDLVDLEFLWAIETLPALTQQATGTVSPPIQAVGSIVVGETLVSAAYVGSSVVDRLYLGSNIVLE